MGLDQYLYKKMYVGNTYKDPEEQVKVDIKGVKQERVSSISEQVLYWRKANQIHFWFQRHLGEDVNLGQEQYITRELLTELLNDINKVLEKSVLVRSKICNGYRLTEKGKEPIMVDGKKIKNPATAKKLLPTTDGFFFGSTDYDQYYIEQLEYSKKDLEDVLKEEGDFYYEASW